MVYRLDFSVAQDLFKNLGGARHSLQFRADFLNFSNLLNHDWGVGQRLINNAPLTNPGVDAQGQATYRLRAVNNELMSKSLGDDRGSVGRLPDPVQPALHLQLEPRIAGLPRAERVTPARPSVFSGACLGPFPLPGKGLDPRKACKIPDLLPAPHR